VDYCQYFINLIAEADEDGISAKEAGEELGLSKFSISRYRKRLEDEGVIQYSTPQKEKSR
jgi:transposase